MTSDGERRLRPNPAAELHWRDWGGDSVVMDACTGQLHLLDPLSAALMACFEARPQAPDDALRSMASDLGSPDPAVDDDLRRAVAAGCARFLALGWLLADLG